MGEPLMSAVGLGSADDGDDLEMAEIVLRHTKPSS
jgi:hypothetical protein